MRHIVRLFSTLYLLLGLGSAALGEDVVTLGTAPAGSMVIPYFESDTEGAEQTTFFSISNKGENTAIAKVTLWTQAWQPTLTFDVVLEPDDIQTLNMATLLKGFLPITNSRGLPGCGEYPERAFGEAEAALLAADHTGLTCLGDHTAPLAKGFITVDAVHRCTPLATRAYADPVAQTAITPGYFGEGGTGLASNENIFVGDYHLLNGSESFAQGGTPLHLRADADLFTGENTFYSFLSGGSDNRAPLGDTIYGRFLNGGAFDGGTDLLLFRVPAQHVRFSELECGRSPWSEAETTGNLIVNNEAGVGFLSQRPFLWGTESFALETWDELPPFGALDLQLPAGSQNAGILLHNASGRFSTSSDMIPIPRRDLGEDSDGEPAGFRVDFTFTVAGPEVSFAGVCLDDHQPVTCENGRWSLGDGSSATGVDPVHLYAQAGTYLVTFTAENDGALASRSKHVLIEEAGDDDDGEDDDGEDDDGEDDDGEDDDGEDDDGDNPPVLEIGFGAAQIPGTLTAVFEGICVLDGESVLCENAAWSFGDGTQGSGASTEHTYPAAGTYEVTFTASAGGQTDSHTKSITLEDPGDDAPDLAVTFTAVQVPETLTVVFSGTCALDGESVECETAGWTFGDGTQASGSDVEHTYPAPGTYPVTFSASAGGQDATLTANVLVEDDGGDEEPVLTVTFDAQQTPETLTVVFSGTCALDGESVECETAGWTFGDGTQASGSDVEHTYPAPGTYPVTFSASAGGQDATLTANVLVEDDGGDEEPVLTVTFDAQQTPGTLTVVFSGTCALDGEPVACEMADWTFGDGTQASGSDVEHTYPAPGTYPVTLDVAAGGQSGSHTADVLVEEPNEPPTVSSFVCLPNPLIAGRIATCTFVVTDADGDDVTWRVTTDSESNTCIEGVDTGDCTQSHEGASSGGTVVPFNLLSTAGFTEDATLRVEAADETGAEAEVMELDVVIEPNEPPSISIFACSPGVVLPGTLSLCTLAILDLNDDDVEWTVEVVGGTEACLDSNPGPSCQTMVQGTGNLFPLTLLLELRTPHSTPGQTITLRATIDDGLDVVQRETTVLVL